MPGEWRNVSIEEIAIKVAMGPFGSDIKTDNFVLDGVPVIRGGNLTSGRFLGGTFVFLTEEKANELANANALPGDLVFTHRGTLGQVGLIPAGEHERYVVSQSQMKLTCQPAVADPAFVYYFFKSPLGQRALLMNTSQTGVPAISRPVTSLKQIRLRLPPLPEQRAIAHILGSLDDKIDLNRRLNETLEAMARALFKSWFVDFDLVRAKAQGRDPGLPAHLAALFPDRLVESELGEIPEGWEVGTLGDVAMHLRRGVQPDEIDPETPYIALEHMPKRCIALSEWGTADGVESNKFKFKRGEILFGKLRPYFHKVGVAPVDGVCSTDIVVASPTKEAWFGFVLGLMSDAAFVDYTNGSSTGTKMPRTSWDEMARYPVMLPSDELATAFTRQIRPAIDRMISAIHESRTLAALRDALLPKLMSGEVRVRSVAVGVREVAH
jgi:type I restriction enzyme, S subunit